MTDDERQRLQAMPVAKIRRNYHLCQAQLDGSPDYLSKHPDVARKIQIWQASYLAELVRRGARV